MRFPRIWKLYIMCTSVVLTFMVAGGLILQDKLKSSLREQLVQEVIILIKVIEKNMPDTEDTGTLDRFCETYQNLTGARVSIIKNSGSIIGESDPKVSKEKSRLDRPEIQGALKTGLGVITRHSDSLGVDMLYVASLLRKKAIIIRMAVPLTKILMVEQKVMILVTLTLYFTPLGAITVCFFLARRMASKEESNQESGKT